VCGASLNTMETHSHSTELANPLETQALEEKRESLKCVCLTAMRDLEQYLTFSFPPSLLTSSWGPWLSWV